MKSLFILSALFGTLFMGSLNERSNPELTMDIAMEEALQEKVRVYDYDGNLLKELKVTDVATNDISVIDHILLDESDFAFEHLGDYYYFQEK